MKTEAKRVDIANSFLLILFIPAQLTLLFVCHRMNLPFSSSLTRFETKTGNTLAWFIFTFYWWHLKAMAHLMIRNATGKCFWTCKQRSVNGFALGLRFQCEKDSTSLFMPANNEYHRDCFLQMTNRIYSHVGKSWTQNLRQPLQKRFHKLHKLWTIKATNLPENTRFSPFLYWLIIITV